MKRRTYKIDLPNFSKEKWVSVWYAKERFFFLSEKFFFILEEPHKSENVKKLLSDNKIEKYFIRNHFEVFKKSFNCKIKNCFILEILSKICRTYSKSHSFEALVEEFSYSHFKHISDNIDQISHGMKMIQPIFQKQKEIAMNEKRWHIIVKAMKVYENLNYFFEVLVIK